MELNSASLEWRSGPPSSSGRKISAFLVTSASLGILQSLLATFLPHANLSAQMWFVPAIVAFCIGGGLSIAFLCFGRYLFGKEPYALRAGLAFWLSSLVDFAYLLTRQEIVPGLRSTPAYLFYLVYLVLLLPSLSFSFQARTPERTSQAGLWSALGWSTLLCLVLIGGIIALDNRLPRLDIERRYAFFSQFMPYTFFLLYLAGVYVHWQRFKQTQMSLLGYFLGFLVVSLWVFPGVILSQRPYDTAWYSYYLIPSIGLIMVYLALLLEYSNLYKRLGSALGQMSLTHRLNALVSSSLSLKDICETLSREIQKIVPYDRAAINLLQEDRRYARVYAEESRLPASAIPEGFSVLEGTATDWVLNHREPLICEDVLQDARFPLTHKRYHELGIRSYLILPLVAKGKVIGALNLGSLTPGRYGKKEIEILSPGAEILSLAVENSSLYQESRKREEIQKLLKELSQDITSLDIDSLLKKLTEKIREVLRVEISDVRLREGGVWRVVGVSGIDAERLRIGSTGKGRGGGGWIAKNQRPLVISDITQSRDFPMGETTRRIGVCGYLAVPIFAKGGDVIGIIRALSYQPREFAQEEVDLLQQLANGAAIAIENANLFGEIREKSKELERVNQELLSAYQAKSDFLNTMAHDLKVPIHVMIGSCQLLVDGFFGQLSEQQKKGLEPIDRNAQNLLSLIDEILNLVRLEARQERLRIEKFPLRELLDELGSSFTPLIKERELEFKMTIHEAIPRLQGDKAKLREILQNLLSNALKYTDAGEVELTVCCKEIRSEKERISFSVRDTGIGIREEDLSRIFEPFFMAEGVDRKKYPGSGLGLSIVRRLVELLQGEIAVESQWGKGSTFTVVLPLIHPLVS